MTERGDEPTGLGPRGHRLWLAMADDHDAPGLVLLAEACRMADRLDRLDLLITGDDESWVRIETRNGGLPPVLVVTGLLTEARGCAAELRQLVKALEPAAKTTAASQPGTLHALRARQGA